ncbi:MAG: hypothetical protein LBL28_09435 [Treponema sp.]|jgi:hypothetical protein|nr:hypothetical protein [Treponema sp.]
MKRILTFLLVLTAGTALFAQEFKWSGYFNSGLGIVASDTGGTPYLRTYGLDAGQNGLRLRLNGEWANTGGDAGFKVRLQAQATRVDGYFSLPYAYGWVKALNGIFTFSAGIVDDATWDAGGVVLTWTTGADQGEGLGALVKISPLAGLDIGFGAYVSSIQGGGANNVLALPFNTPLDLDDVKYTVNLGFTLPEVLRLNATFRTANAAGGTGTSSRALAGFKVLAVPNLTAILETEFNNLEDFGNTGLIGVYETLGYKTGSLNFGLNAAEYISRAAGADFSVELDPWVSYAFGGIVPQVDIVYFFGGAWNPDAYGRYIYANGNDAGQDVLSIRPAVKFNIGSVFVELGDVLYFNNIFTDGADTLYNVFYVDFKWSF